MILTLEFGVRTGRESERKRKVCEERRGREKQGSFWVAVVALSSSHPPGGAGSERGWCELGEAGRRGPEGQR